MSSSERASSGAPELLCAVRLRLRLRGLGRVESNFKFYDGLGSEITASGILLSISEPSAEAQKRQWVSPCGFVCLLMCG